MVIKLLGAAFILAASAGLGLYYAGRETFRLHELAEWKKALLILTSEIDYLRTPLPEACANIAKRTGGGISELFARFTASLNGGDTVYRLWAAALDAYRPSSYLTDEDWDTLDGFGKTLGYLDVSMQLNAIQFVIAHIDAKTEALQGGCERNKRMYRSLGVIGGLLLAVVLW